MGTVCGATPQSANDKRSHSATPDPPPRMAKKRNTSTAVNPRFSTSAVFKPPKHSVEPITTVKSAPASAASIPSGAAKISPLLQMYATSNVIDSERYTSVVAASPARPSDRPAISVSDSVTSLCGRPWIRRYSSRSRIKVMLLSASNNASSVRSNHTEPIAAIDGANPAGATAVGKARIPAPTVEPVINATAPRTLPLSSGTAALSSSSKSRSGCPSSTSENTLNFRTMSLTASR
mmetsp:Transcript_625/g.2245  ORF Transcript_625/g.2245 Transcript_625/m.2245 type:complete len:235 (-) Transcript_625:269-973(-)